VIKAALSKNLIEWVSFDYYKWARRVPASTDQRHEEFDKLAIGCCISCNRLPIIGNAIRCQGSNERIIGPMHQSIMVLDATNLAYLAPILDLTGVTLLCPICLTRTLRCRSARSVIGSSPLPLARVLSAAQ